jgi:predicted ABC-type ATPase
MHTELQKKVAALRGAISLGCTGAHKSASGDWLPCSTPGELLQAAFGDEIKSRITPGDIESWRSRRKKRGKRRKRRDNWEKLGERGVAGIDRISTGLVSAVTGGSRPPITNGYVAPAGMSTKSAQQAFNPRDDDDDVYFDIESARKRSRQLGCIGVSRRVSKSGKTVWMPCTNMSDYARLTGSTALGRRHIQNAARGVVRTVVREELKRRKKSIYEELSNKSIGRRIGRAAGRVEPFDPNAIDGDEDGVVQDGTPFERPATPSAPKIENPVERDATENDIDSVRNWIEKSSTDDREALRGDPIEMFDAIPGQRGMASFSVGDRGSRRSTKRPRPQQKPQKISGMENREASQTNPFRNMGGRAMGQIIRGLVKPENKGKKDRTAYIIGGNIGSGKTTVLEGHLVPQGLVPGVEEAATIDPDFIKLGLRGYDDGAGARMVHRDSQKATDKTIVDAAAEGADLVITGSGASRQRQHIREAKARGERVVGHYVHVPKEEAAKRIRSRAQRDGRQIDDNTGHMARSIPQMVSSAVNAGDMDEFYLWDNDVPEGGTPRLIASSVDGELSIIDQDKFDEFMMGNEIISAKRTRGMASRATSLNGEETAKALKDMGLEVSMVGDIIVELPKGTAIRKYYEEYVLPRLVVQFGRTHTHASRKDKPGVPIVEDVNKLLGLGIDKREISDKRYRKRMKEIILSDDRQVFIPLFSNAPINGPRGEQRFGDLDIADQGISIDIDSDSIVLDSIAKKVGVSREDIDSLIAGGISVGQLQEMSIDEIKDYLKLI